MRRRYYQFMKKQCSKISCFCPFNIEYWCKYVTIILYHYVGRYSRYSIHISRIRYCDQKTKKYPIMVSYRIRVMCLYHNSISGEHKLKGHLESSRQYLYYWWNKFTLNCFLWIVCVPLVKLKFYNGRLI